VDPADRATEIEERQRAAQPGMQPAAVVKRPLNASPVACIECGLQIPEERLTVVPTATRCVDCQDEREQSERRIA